MCIRDSYFYAACVAANTIGGIMGGCDQTFFIQRNDRYSVSYTHLDVYKRQP